MNALRVLFDRQSRLIAVAMMLALALIVPALAQAAQLEERSVALSSASAGAAGVTYQVNFTAQDDAAAFIVDFCSDSPLIGQTCTGPTGFTTATVGSSTAGFTATSVDANTVKVVGTIDVSTEDAVSVELTGITNPDNAGSIYARVISYAASTGVIDSYTSTAPGAHVDDGSMAIAITDTVGVSGAVLETMTFCVSAAAPTMNCTGVTAPTLALGETVGSTVALQPGTISTGNLYTQISTNAASGAIVSLKSNATDCGGLMRFGSTACDIAPALQTGIAAGDSKFGVMTAAAATDPSDSVGGDTSGTIQAVPASGYNSSTYALNFVSGNATGVTSTYGDPFLNTNSLPVNNKNMQLTFGATVNNDTPAGLYSADLSLIATGKF